MAFGIETFISFASARADEAMLERLEAHLAALGPRLSVWHRGHLVAGEEPAREAEAQLAGAQVILLLISADYLASEECRAEAEQALAQHAAGETRVIPIIVRACSWRGASWARLEVLPAGGRPVASSPDQDEAWTAVVDDLRAVLDPIADAEARAATSSLPAPGKGPVARARPSPSHDVPTPVYPDEQTRLTSRQLDNARVRKAKLDAVGANTAKVNQEILNLKRQLREGGQLRAGDSLCEGRYVLLEQLGRGGFAIVWKAHDREQNQTVAIKVLHPNLAGDSVRQDRFLRGARIMAELGHPAVVRVLKPHGEDGGWHYFVMEYLPGGDLRQAVLQRKLPPDRVLPVILRVGEALVLAHSRGILHRDVKPANILLDDAGEPKLTDFDLVTAGDTTGGTRTGALGTFIYAAPEMMDRPQDGDARVDIYGLGMTAVCCFQGTEPSWKILQNPDQVLDALPCSELIQDVLRKAIQSDRDARFSEASAFCDALQQALRRTTPQQMAARANRSTSRALRRMLGRAELQQIDPADAQPASSEVCIGLMSEDTHRIRSTFHDVADARRQGYIDWLVGKLGGAIGSERSAAAKALFELKYKHLPVHLMELARDPSSSSRRLAAFYLGELRAANALGVVTELTQDKSPHVRAAAREALRKIQRHA